jgi:hypothetical protein
MGIFDKIGAIFGNADLQKDSFVVAPNQWKELPSGAAHWPGFYYNHATTYSPIDLGRGGSTLVYHKQGSEWTALYAVGYQGALSFDSYMWYINKGDNLIILRGSFGSSTLPRSPESFTVISIKESARRSKPNVDISDYQAVIRAFGPA